MGRCGDAKKRLLDATLELIWQQSYGAVTVDAICAKADVKKGSFYYFFESKDDLVAAALEDHWAASIRPDLDRIFSPSEPPLERLRRCFEEIYVHQIEARKKAGRTLGCPYTSLGCEVNGQTSPVICEKVRGILRGYMRYFESALRDAQAEGLFRGKDVAELAKALFAFKDGVMTQARIQDDPELIRTLWAGALNLLGIQQETKEVRA